MDKNPTEAKSGAKEKRLKKIVAIVAASLVGINVAGIAATISGYDAYFKRYERPDYSLYPGLYCYDRVKDTLEREVFTIKSGENDLAAYYYPAENAEGLVVLAHGIHAGADDYIPLIEAIVDGGFAVLTYDVTGNYNSGGDSVIGMCQSLCDIDVVLDYARDTAPFCDMPKLVIGHSWGGYAAGSALALHSEICAAVLLAPMNDGTTIMVETAERYAGEIAYTAKPIFDVYQKYLFGDYVNYNALIGINSTTVPVLIAQGTSDDIITHDGLSVTAHLDEITNPNVTVYWGEGYQGSHTGIWHSDDAEAYVKAVADDIAAKEAALGRSLTNEELAEYYSTVDHRRYSDVNKELIDLILATFRDGVENVK